MYQQFRAPGVQVCGILQDEAAVSREFAKESGVGFPIPPDEYPYEISEDCGVKIVPPMFLISADGRVELTTDGFCKVDLLEIHKWLGRYFSVTPQTLFQPSDPVPEFKPG